MISIKNELKLHIKFCKKWKIPLYKLKKVKYLKSNRAYTDYVLRVGSKGSILDLFVCLAPCIIGYGEIGFRLSKFKDWKKSKYREWIALYSSKEYQSVAKNNIDYLDQLFKNEKKINYTKLRNYFKKATILEKNFWNMN